MSSQSLSKARIIREPAELTRALRTGRVVTTECFRAYYLAGEGPPGVAFLAGRRVGGAVQRNRAKRVLREAFRTCDQDLSGVRTLVFVATKLAPTASYSELREHLWGTLRRIADRTGCNGK